ncbi:MAG: hypothetical protein VB090_01530, partial [Petrimonas sp.]|nr:hypothetical protein [Petrimonas sp.]
RRYTMGQQKVHEHEASGGGHRRRFHCRLTLFPQRLQTNLRITLDTTISFEELMNQADKKLYSEKKKYYSAQNNNRRA